MTQWDLVAELTNNVSKLKRENRELINVCKNVLKWYYDDLFVLGGRERMNELRDFIKKYEKEKE